MSRKTQTKRLRQKSYLLAHITKISKTIFGFSHCCTQQHRWRHQNPVSLLFSASLPRLLHSRLGSLLEWADSLLQLQHCVFPGAESSVKKTYFLQDLNKITELESNWPDLGHTSISDSISVAHANQDIVSVRFPSLGGRRDGFLWRKSDEGRRDASNKNKSS